MLGALAYGDSEMYKKVSFLSQEVYFPKPTSEYIDTLLADNSTESYAKLSELYFKLGNEAIMRKYFNFYMNSDADYLSKSRLCNAVGEYGLEISNILKYIENKPFKEKIYYRNYISKLIKEKNLNSNFKGSINKKDILISYIDSEKDFSEYFYTNSWNEQEKKEIVEILKKRDLEKSKLIKNIFREIADKYDIADYYYYKIENNYDVEGYSEYYAAIEEEGIEPIIRNEFEKLHYYQYKSNLTEYKKLADELAVKYNKSKEYKKLYTLYKITGDMNILYNLSLINEEFLFKFIKEMYIIDSGEDGSAVNGQNREMVLKTIDSFLNSYTESIYTQEVLKIKLAYLTDYEEGIKTADSYLAKGYDNYVFAKKAEFLSRAGKKGEAESMILSKLYSGYSDPVLIEFLIKMVGQNSQGLYNVLIKLDDKSYFFEYARKNSIKIPKELENEAIDYFFEAGDYTYLYQYKERLSYEQYRRVIENGMLVFMESANKRFPYEKEWMDLGRADYFYFNDNFKEFNVIAVRQLLEKRIRNDAENYYLAKYFYFTGDTKKAKEYFKGIAARYVFSEEIANFKEKLENNKQNNEEGFYD